MDLRQRLNGKGAKPQARPRHAKDLAVEPTYKEVPQKRKEAPGFLEQDRLKRAKAANSPVSRDFVAPKEGTAAGGGLNAAPHGENH